MPRILVACEFSGTVRDAFAARGWDAWSCDLLPCERGGQHIQGNVLDVLSCNPEDWSLMIAFPPCTYLCGSGLHWNKRRPERAALTEDALRFVLALADKGWRQALKDYLATPAVAVVTGSAVPALIGTFTANTVRNIWAHSVIFCGHFPDGAVQFPAESVIGESRGDWYIRQMLGSANISGSKTLHLMTGNLSHQIEHHCFPDLPSNRYAEVAPEVLYRYDFAAIAKALAPQRRYWALVGNGNNRIAAAEVRIKLSELCYKSIACDATEDKKHIDLSSEPMILVCAAGLTGSTADDVAKVVIAYEPVSARQVSHRPVVVACETSRRRVQRTHRTPRNGTAGGRCVASSAGGPKRSRYATNSAGRCTAISCSWMASGSRGSRARFSATASRTLAPINMALVRKLSATAGEA